MSEYEKQNLTRQTLLKLTEDDEGWIYVCRWCGESLKLYPETPNKKGQRYHIKTNKLIKNFLEMHFGKHMQELHPQFNKTTNTNVRQRKTFTI